MSTITTPEPVQKTPKASIVIRSMGAITQVVTSSRWGISASLRWDRLCTAIFQRHDIPEKSPEKRSQQLREFTTKQDAVRLLVQDDPEQCRQAIALWQQLLSEGGVYLSKVVVVEVVWVLQRSYQFNRQDITSVVNSLLHTDGVVVEDLEQLVKALALFSSEGADFSDYVTLNQLVAWGHCCSTRLIKNWAIVWMLG